MPEALSELPDEHPSDAELVTEIRSLKRQIESLRGDLKDKNAETRFRTNVLAAFLALVALVGGVLGIFTVQATSDNADAIAASNRRWCPVIQPLAPRANDPKPAGEPEQVERALRIRRAFAKLVDDFDCN